MQELHQRVKTLSEALPYIQRFRSKIIVIKYGGSAMLNDSLKHKCARDIVLLKEVGMHPVLIHGGGPEISKNLQQAEITTRFVNGLRVTDEETIKVVEQTLAEINRNIVVAINQHGGQAIGVTDYLLKARRLPPIEENGKTVDLGYVGKVVGVASELKKLVIDEARVPVISPVGKGKDGSAYNINGDLAAGSVAVSLQAEKLILLTDTQGILDDSGKLVSETTGEEVARMIAQGTIDGGMLPKVQCAFEAVQSGVRSAHIVDGRVQHALLLELLTDKGVGTLIRKT